MKVKRILAVFLAVVMVMTSVMVSPAPTAMAAEADARLAYDSFIKKFIEEEGGVYKLKQSGTVWSAAETIEVVIDGYELFGDEKYKEIVCGLIDWYVGNNGEYWEDNGFNDDVMWAVIMCTRTYLLTGTERYLTYAKNNFEMCYNRAWSNDLGGGLWWRVENTTKNACVNGPGTIAACLLGEATGEESYFTKAKAIIDWEIKTLVADDGGVWDSYNNQKEFNTWVATYNQGTFIGACTMVYQHFGEQKYFDYAKKAAERAKKFGLNDEDFIDDAVGFKGILARWLRYFIVNCDVDDCNQWYEEQVSAAWSNRNSDNLIWTLLKTKTEDNIENSTNELKKKYAGWGCSSGLAWVLNGTDLDARQEAAKKRTEPIALTAAKMAYDITMQEAEAVYEAGPDKYLASTWTVFEDEYLSAAELDEDATLADLKNATSPLAAALYGLKKRNSPGTLIEMESGVLAAGAKKVDAKNCSGGKYVGNTGGEKNGSVSFIVTADRSGEHIIYMKYCTAQDRKTKVTVNGKGYSINCKSVGSWDKPGNDPVEIKVSMNRGENTVVFEGDNGANAPNLDSFEFKRTNSSDNQKIDVEELATVKNELASALADSKAIYEAGQGNYTDESWNAYKSAYENAQNASANATIEDLTKLKVNLERAVKGLKKKSDGTQVIKGTLEMESGVCSASATVTNATTCSGGKYVGYIGGADKGAVSFKVSVEKAGEYLISVRYCTWEDRSLTVQVNGKDYTVTCKGNKSWNVPATSPADVTVNLKKGENTIVFTAVGDGPNLDRFTYKRTDSINNQNLDAAQDALTVAVNESKTVFEAGQNNYTDESWNAYKAAYEKAMNPPAEALAEDLTKIKEELATAQSGLKEKSAQDNETNTDDGTTSGGETKPDDGITSGGESKPDDGTTSGGETKPNDGTTSGGETKPDDGTTSDDKNNPDDGNDSDNDVSIDIGTKPDDGTNSGDGITSDDKTDSDNESKPGDGMTSDDGNGDNTGSDDDADDGNGNASTEDTNNGNNNNGNSNNNGTTEDTNNGSTNNGSTNNGTTEDTNNGSTDNGSTNNGSNNNGTIEDTNNGSNNAGTTGGTDNSDNTGNSGNNGNNGMTGGIGNIGNNGSNNGSGNSGNNNSTVDTNNGGNNISNGNISNSGNNNSNGDTSNSNNNSSNGNIGNGGNNGLNGDAGNSSNNNSTAGNGNVGNNNTTGTTNNTSNSNTTGNTGNNGTNGATGNAQTDNSVQNGVLVEEIVIDGISKKIAVGKKVKLTAEVYPEDATNDSLVWESSNTDYATVTQTGVVKTKKAGKNKKVTITAKAKDGSGIKATYKIDIMPYAVKKITIKATGKTVQAGNSVKLTAVVSPNALFKKLNKKVKWTSSNQDYATVTSSGLVKTKIAGAGESVKITATATDGSNKKKTIVINIK